VEGLVTAAVAVFVWKSRPEILESATAGRALGAVSLKKVLVGLAVAAVVVGGVLSWFASAYPDGLEWSVEKTAGTAELGADGGVYDAAAKIQGKTALLPDYGFADAGGATGTTGADGGGSGAEEAPGWPAADVGTTVSGLVGGLLTLALTALAGGLVFLSRRKKKSAAA